jgi:DNA-binding transcriptional LysR family regulator
MSSVEIDDIAMFPFVGPRLGRHFGEHFPVGSAMGSMSADGRYFDPAILCPTWTSVREIVVRSDAVSARIRVLLEMPENRGDIVVLPVAAPWFQSAFAVMWRHDRMPHPALKAFRDAVRRNEANVMDDTSAIHVVAA